MKDNYKNSKYFHHITHKLTKRDLLEQLAEECDELGKASLKLIRGSHLSGNVTPESKQSCEDNFMEEILDVIMVLQCLGYDVFKMKSKVNQNYKWKRWAERLNYEEYEDDD